jgi:ubiquinone/menaquinone biosynthesis C-methylase UbiE
MVDLTIERLAKHAERARVLQSNGTIHFPLQDYSVDRVISTYVLDILSETGISKFLCEAYRVLGVGGKLCLVSLTKGSTFLSGTVSAVWASIFHLRPSWVGGCRPIRLEQYINSVVWEIEYRNVVTTFGVPSEVLVARAKIPPISTLHSI